MFTMTEGLKRSCCKACIVIGEKKGVQLKGDGSAGVKLPGAVRDGMDGQSEKHRS